MKKTFLSDPYWQVLIGLFVLLFAFMPHSFFIDDKWYYASWADFLSHHPAGTAYENPNFDYPPLISYPLWLAGIFYGNYEKLDAYFYYFKTFVLLFDFAAVIVIIHWLGKAENRIAYALLLLANPLFLYNTCCWGQVDGILAALVLFSLYFLIKNRPAISLIMLVLALNFKAQAIIFVPVIGLLFIWKLTGVLRLKKLLRAIAAAAVVQVLILLPFILAGQLPKLMAVVFASVDRYPFVSMNAFNFWHLVLRVSPFIPDSTVVFAGLTYKQIGLLLFCFASFLILFPVFYKIISSKLKTGQAALINTQTILLMFAGIPLMFFFFNTQMHERYSHPAIIFFAAYAIYTGRWLFFGIILLAYGLNLDVLIRYFNFPNYDVFIFIPEVAATLYALLVICFYFSYYQALSKPHTHPIQSPAPIL